MLLSRLGIAGAFALPGALTVYLAFNSGGFFAAQPALVAVFLALLAVMLTTLAARPFAGLGRTLGVAIAALALFALWALVSARWSGSSARAMLEFTRTLAYVLALLVFGSLATSHARVRWAARSVGGGLVVVCAAGLLTRLLPDVWQVAPTLQAQRLSYPTTYWNTFGLLAAVAIILCFALTSDDEEPRLGRVLAAAAVPMLSAALFFSFSRGAIAVGAIGLVAFLAAARAPLALTAIAAAVPAAAVAIAFAYGADQLASPQPVVAEAVAQGHRLAWVLGASVLAAAMVRGLLLALDRRIAGLRLPPTLRRVRVPVAVLAAGAAVAVAMAAGAPAALSTQYQRFMEEDKVRTTDFRRRLENVGNNGRRQTWNVAIRGLEEQRVRGQGAGTYDVYWARHRPEGWFVRDAHSLYLEVGDELGAVGLLLLLSALATLMLGTLYRAWRASHRCLYAGVFAAFLAWAVEAGVDWQWEMPSITLPVVVLAGMAVAAKPTAESPGDELARSARVPISLGLILVAVAPALVAISDGRIAEAARAFNFADDCRTAPAASLSSLSALANRPQPYEVLGYCDLRRGFPLSAVRAMHSAVERDPRSWQYHYGLSVARGAAGLDPRPAARAALARNPREPIVQRALARLDGDRRHWRSQAARNREAFESTGYVGAR